MAKQKPARRRLPAQSLLGIMALGAFLVGMDSMLVSTLIPAMTATVHVPAHAGGLFVTMYALAYGLSAPLFGPVSDHFGRKTVLLCGLFIFGISTALTGWGQTFSELLVFRALAGLGGAIIMPTIFALVGDRVPYEQRGQAMGLVMGALLSASVIGVPLGSFLAFGTTWRTPFWVVGVLTGIVILVVGKTVTATPPPQMTAVPIWSVYQRQFRTAFTQTPVFFSLLSSFLWMAGLYGMFAYIGVYYTHNFHLNVAEIGLIIMVAGFGNMMGNVLGGRWSDKIGRRRVMMGASIVAAVCVVSFSLFTRVLVAAIIAQVVWNVALGSGTATLTALVSELSPSIRGAVLSLSSSAMYLGASMATATSAALLATGGFFRIGILCGLAALAVGPTIRYFVQERRVEATVE